MTSPTLDLEASSDRAQYDLSKHVKFTFFVLSATFLICIRHFFSSKTQLLTNVTPQQLKTGVLKLLKK